MEMPAKKLKSKKKLKPLKPLWIYKEDDLSTWKYLGVNFSHKGKERTAWVKNPGFEFKHLDKRYDEGVVL